MLADISAGRTEAALKRIAAGEDIHETDAFGTTPLMVAALTNQLDIMRALLPRHDLRNLQKDNKGLTAVHYAIQADSYAALALFQEAGIDLLNQPNKIGATPLMVAARNGQINVVRYLLSLNRDDIKLAVDHEGHSAVYYAVHGGQFNVLQTMHKAGLDLNQPNCKGTTPLMLAAKHGHANIFRFLLSLNRGDIKQAVDLEGYSTVHFAAQAGQLEVLQTLHAAGFDFNKPNKIGSTPLMVAAINGKINAVRYILSLNRDEIKQAVDFKGLSAAHCAAKAGHVDVLQTLHKAGLDLNQPNKTGSTPLMTAAINGKTYVVRYLLSLNRDDIKKAKDVNDCSVAHYAAAFGSVKMLLELEAAGINLYPRNIKGATPLMAAAAHGQINALRYLLQGRPDFKQAVDLEGLTAAHHAATGGQAEVLQALQAEGFDLNQANKVGATPLMLAAFNGKANAVRYLLSLNRDDIKQAVDFKGISTAHCAAQAGHVEILQTLHAAGFDLNQANKMGATPLMTAAINGKTNAVRYLLSLNRADMKQAVNIKGLSAVHYAVQGGHVDVLQALQAAGLDLNKPAKRGATPLMLAIFHGKMNTVRYLLSLNRADIKQAVDLEGDSAVHFAAQSGQAEVLEALQAAGIDLNQPNKKGATPLMLALHYGNRKAVRYFLSLNRDDIKQAVDLDGFSAAHFAAQSGLVENLQALEAAGFDLNQAGKNGSTPLMTAALNGKINTVRYLLSLNRDDIKEAVNSNGYSAAHYAAEVGHVEVLQALQAAGLNLNQPNKMGATPLMLAAKTNQINVLRYLLRLNRADIKEAVNSNGYSAAHYAAEVGHVAVLQALQAAGLDLNQPNKLGSTPLMTAASSGKTKVVRYLLSLNRADIRQAVDLKGYSAAYYALESGHVEVLHTLHAAGLDLNLRSKQGATPLIIATIKRNINALHYLLSLNCADINQAVDFEGHSPMHFAAKAGHVDVLEILHAAGLNINHPNKMGTTPLMHILLHCKSPTSLDITCVKWFLAHGAMISRGMSFRGRPIETFILEEADRDGAWKAVIKRQPNLATLFEPAQAGGAATHDSAVTSAAHELLSLRHTRTFTPMHQADVDAMDTSPDAGGAAEDKPPAKRLRLSQR